MYRPEGGHAPACRNRVPVRQGSRADRSLLLEDLEASDAGIRRGRTHVCPIGSMDAGGELNVYLAEGFPPSVEKSACAAALLGIRCALSITPRRRSAISLHPELDSTVPKLTARVARASFPKGTLCLKIDDELGTIFRDQDFVDLFPRRGKSACAPFRHALVTILQFLEGLSDRAAAAVRARTDWKSTARLRLHRHRYGTHDESSL